MAVCGMPEDSTRCPDCGQVLRYNAGTRGYLHVLQRGCKVTTTEGVATLDRRVEVARP